MIETWKKRVAVKNNYPVSIGEGVCHNCHGKHSLKDCKDFLALSCEERWVLVSKEKLCFICLRQRHRAAVCRFKRRCSENECVRFHHSLLHVAEDTAIRNASCQGFPSDHGVVLGVVPVIIDGPNGTCHATALLDTGADTSLIREDLAQRLGFKEHAQNISLNAPIGSAVRICIVFPSALDPWTTCRRSRITMHIL
ncbi:retropepsin-like aspartic protease [Streptococcus dysgalactiae]|uniref:retropepsin-like aspartic protease n=1 Tax=Streptococcus dysgalactiae TaxID=1334 RepID=UPI003D7982C8